MWFFVVRARLTVAQADAQIAFQAHGWDPKAVLASSKERLVWKCELGHTWTANVQTRILQNTRCPYCVGTKTWPGFNDLATLYPEIAALAHGWDPTLVRPHSHTVMQWRCAKGHLYKRGVARMVALATCSVCTGRSVQQGVNDLATSHPLVAARALSFDPTKYSAGSLRTETWECTQGHTYKQTIYKAAQGQQCGVCANRSVATGVNDLATTHPYTAKELRDPEPSTITCGSATIGTWRCVNGHAYQMEIRRKTLEQRPCPHCSPRNLQPGVNDLATTHPEIGADAARAGTNPALLHQHAASMQKWQCEHGHQWEQKVIVRTLQHTGCPACYDERAGRTLKPSSIPKNTQSRSAALP